VSGTEKRVTGVVYSDLGRAASFMALDWVARSLSDKLGFSPYPGTLNLRLESEPMKKIWLEVRRAPGIEIAAPDAAFCQARCFLARIEGKHQGAVILPAVADYPADKIEIVAPVRLKDELKLADGMAVTLEFLE
jgi:CTP-dependent riboflavin kinase